MTDTPRSAGRYSATSKLLHWLVFGLFVYQFVGANIMTRLSSKDELLGMSQDTLYQWHKSIGLVLIVVAMARLIWRRTTPLPPWDESLTPAERRITERVEFLLYGLMFVLPITGFLFVMAGDYGVKLFGEWKLPNPIGKIPLLAWWSRLCHIVLGYAAVVVIAWHVGLGLKKHYYDQTQFLHRMLPGK